MKAQPHAQRGPSVGDSRARLGAVKAPRFTRPRLRRADGLDRVSHEPRTAPVDGPQDPASAPAIITAKAATASPSSAPSILVTIGQQMRLFYALVTSAPPALDAPATFTLYASTLADLATFAEAELTVDRATAPTPARLVLVDAIELSWQRARYREAGHRLVPADAGLVGLTVLQRWLWRRLQFSDDPGTRCD
jgi:hypothetical protein